eukprot:972855_1
MSSRSTLSDMNSMSGYLSTLSASALICYLGYQLLSTRLNSTTHSIDSIPLNSQTTFEQSWSASHMLFLKAFIAALTSGLGGFPLYLVGDIPMEVMGFCIIFAAGLMSGCSVVLFIEALEFESSIIYVFIYTLIGIIIIHLISHFVSDLEDFEFAGLKGKSASKALLIVLSMG